MFDSQSVFYQKQKSTAPKQRKIELQFLTKKYNKKVTLRKKTKKPPIINFIMNVDEGVVA